MANSSINSSKPTAYAELHVLSNYSFLRSASHPQELVTQAAALGYQAIAITDECSLAGIVKAYVAAKEHRIKLIVGSEILLTENIKLVLLAPTRQAYSELSALITLGRRRSEKGQYQLKLNDLELTVPHCLAIWLPENRPEAIQDETIHDAHAKTLGDFFRQRLWLGVELLLEDQMQAHYLACHQLAQQYELPMLACGDVHMHQAQCKPLLDTLTAIRLNCSLDALGTRVFSNAERHLQNLTTLQKRYPPALLAESVRISEYCHFTLDELRYEYPKEVVPSELTAYQYLQQLVNQGAQQRWADGVPPRIEDQIKHELKLIRELRYEYYFLTVYDIVHFARSRHILCQGRGSATNSVVCYCLFITEVAPDKISLLFERFISKERNEPPDIDVDFEHERREEVIQYIYKKYSRDRAALAATVITYRPRSAIRDVGKALGLDSLFIDQLAKSLAWWDRRNDLLQRFKEQQVNNASQTAEHFFTLVQAIMGFPRHLSQHVGGFIITRSPISTLVPVENASMPERTVIQWDKNDIEALGLLKIDILALGMLSAIRKCFELVNAYQTTPLTMQSIPSEDPLTYEMLCQGDSIGVFQVESRAQISMLPRLKPQCFYDLVVEVAIVRPGPIQGDMVHPYLKRRQGLEPVSYPSDDVKSVLERTLGVPIFQEQVIKLAMVAAGFSGGEADQLRRAMASWGHNGNLQIFEEKLINGMLQRGHSVDFAKRLFRQMQGFGEYGFPESHAASFALLVYVSAWLKRHYPAAFYCALLNSQPMGFYSPSQLLQDARRHGIRVLPVEVQHSDWDCTLAHSSSTGQQAQRYSGTGDQPRIRLGMRIIKGMNHQAAERIVLARIQQGFTHLQDLTHRAQLNQADMDALVAANALNAIAGHRYQAHWQAQAIEQTRPLLATQENTPQHSLDDDIELPPPTESQELLADYNSLGLTLNRHPMALLREQTPFNRCKQASQLVELNQGRFVRVAGIVTGRQRPGTASGVIFLTLEDETGNINVIVWKQLQERCRQTLLTGKLLLIKGTVESDESVIHVIAGDIIDCSEKLKSFSLPSRDFH